MANRITRLTARVAADQRIRFLMVGGTNTIVGYAVFAALATWVFADVYLGYLVSLVISYVIAITLAFVLYRRFVFVVKGNVVGDFIRFVSVYIVAILANAAALPLLVEVLRLHPLPAQAIVLIATTVLSFVGHKYFSFRRKPTTEPAVGAPTQEGASPASASGQ
ncbi:GtrA family protein [Microbacterium sp. P5_E9]